MDVFNCLGQGEQKGKSQTLLRGAQGQHQRHSPETKEARSSAGGCLTEE